MDRLSRTVYDKNGKVKTMKDAGRFGDTELAHVTPGEKVLPLSVQTPEVNSVVSREFQRQGVPEERYTVQNTANSKNPETGNKEYFLKKLAKAVLPAVGTAVGAYYGGPAGAAAGNSLGNSLAGNDKESEGGQQVAQGGMVAAGGVGSSLPAPVQAIVGQKDMINAGGLPSMQMTRASLTGSPQPQPMQSQQPSAGLDSPTGQRPLVSGWKEAPLQLVPMMDARVNSSTGNQQFYDTSNIRRNPKTRKMEFFDEQFYLSRNPDVASAVSRGEYKTGLDHYNQWGRNENRVATPAAPALTPSAAPSPTVKATGVADRAQTMMPQAAPMSGAVSGNNFNEMVLRRYGTNLEGASPQERAAINDIFGSTAASVVPGEGRRTGMYGSNQAANQRALRMASERGLDGFGDFGNQGMMQDRMGVQPRSARNSEEATDSGLVAQPQQGGTVPMRVSQMSPVRDNRFRSRRYDTTLARNF